MTSVILSGVGIYASFQCSPPEAYRQAGWNTYVTNDYCVDNANYWEAVCNMILAGYLSVDLAFCYFCIGQEWKGINENYFHHGLGIFGVLTSLVVGRMCLSLSSASSITEVSSIFVSLRAILSFQGQSSGSLYLINGLLMTLTFFVFRVVYQTWMVGFRMVPSLVERGSEMLAGSSNVEIGFCVAGCSMYIALVFLNYYWFYKIFTGLLKFI